MSYVYYTCQWLITPIKNHKLFDTVLSVGESVECYLLFKDFSEEKEVQGLKGCFLANWILRVPSKKVLDGFIVEVSPYFPLFNPQKATEQEFLTVHERIVNSKSTDIVVIPMRTINELGQYNVTLLSK